MFAASKTDGAVAAAQADPFFNSVAALLNTSGTNGAQNNTFIDSSTNNFTITRNGNTTQGSFSPYGEDWSNYFDGTGDGLSTPSFSANLATWTMEFWLNTTGTTDYQTFVHRGNGAAWGDTSIFDLYMRGTTTGVLEFLNGTGGVFLTGTQRINDGVWHHIAFTYDGTNYRLFVDGKLDARQATSAMSTASYLFYIGYDPRNLRYTTGYISNFRFVTGSVVYATTSTTIGATIFTPPTQPLQPIAGTGLLTCKDPNIVDDSANQFTITRNGDVSVQKFGPFPGVAPTTPYFGGYFDGNGDVLTLASNVALAFATGDFTLEMWYYTTVAPTATNVCLYNTGSGNFFIQLRSTAFGIGVVGSAENNAFSASFVADQWYHIAVSRSGSTVRGFVNGTLVGTGSNSVNYGQSGATIGGLTSGAQLITGHISNLRVVKGQALYTTSFTPSAVPLTTTSQGATASNVSLLTCQSSTFVDNSPNNFTLTIAGNTRPTAFAPFALTYTSLQPYTPAVFGGSAYFDGTGDSLTTSSSYLPTSAGVAFTLEFWIYSTRAASSQTRMIESSNMQFNLDNANPGQIRFDLPTGVVNVLNSGAARVDPFTWNHIALTRTSGNAYTLYLNGVTVGTGSSSTAINAVTTISPSTGIQGYVSGFRSLTGVVLYTSNFVPQNTPPLPVTNTSLLLNATNAGIYDAATLNDFETVGNAQVSTSVKVYGTSSMAFDGTGDYLLTASSSASPNFAFGTSNFTIEFWLYLNSVTGGAIIFDNRPWATNGLYPTIYIPSTATTTIAFYTNSADRINSAANTIALSTWYHIALSRSSGSTRLFVNGTQVGSTYTDPNAYLSGISRPVLGASGQDLTGNMNGYLQDVRITRGIARYTTNFTPPAAPLPTF